MPENYHDSVIIKGNKRELHRVIMNVLTNAEQSIREKGTIDISTEVIDKKIVISIKDTGGGIKEEHLSNLNHHIRS